jgi:class 3 adenylate cyclase/tetratricopeptide (TPR) repeat protein
LEICPSCGSIAPPSATTCPRCGNALNVEPTELPREAGGERRRVTVLFCDLVGSTRLSDELDPEDYSDVMHSYYDACARVIEGVGGWIADILGDGLVVYFGYPEAHEDDPVRAVRAGLGLIDAVSDIRLQLSTAGGGLACRVGIETGLVVISDSSSRPREPIWALGRTVNLAARLQQIGGPNTVVIGEGTQRLVAGWFDVTALGSHTIKGIAQPIDVARVTGETGAKDRIGASFPRNLAPFVNRTEQLAILEGTWGDAVNGRGRAVLLRGEAGIGKSRVALALRERLRQVPKKLVVLYCSQGDATSPLRPILEHLERDIGFDQNDLPDVRAGQLEPYLERAGLASPDAVALLAEMLISDSRIANLDASPEERRRLAMDLFCRLLIRDDSPTLVLVEDMHWADPSTAELIEQAVERLASRRVLLLATARPEYEAEWLGLPHASALELASLDAAHTAELAAAVAGATLPREGQALIQSRSGGVPLFVEELTRMVLDSGLVSVKEGNAMMTGLIVEGSVPGTVYDLLVARLGRLGDEAGIAQLAAVVGNEFTAGFLKAVAPEDDEIDAKLSRLVALGIVVREEEGGAESFRFSHALVRDAAYGLLLRRRRREIHGRVADVLVRDFPDTVETRPELAAPHFAESGRTEEAVQHWKRAAQRAVAQHALHEAIDHYFRAIELVRGLPGSPERARVELELSFALGPVIQNVSGFGDPRVSELYDRIAQLAHWLESDVEKFTFLAYGYAMHMVRADYEAARAIAGQLVEVAAGSRSTARQLLAHCMLGTTLFQLGDVTEAMPLIERAIDLYDPVRHERLIEAAAIDPGMVSIGYRAWGEWHRGEADRARATARELLELSSAHPHPFRTATAHVWAAGLAQRLREPDEVARHTEAALALAAEHGYEELERYATCLRGWALAVSGRVEEGVETIRRGLALVPHGGSRAHYSWHLLMLAEAELLAGRPGQALAELDRARAFAAETGERLFDPEIARLEGEALRASGARIEEAEAPMRRALEAAQRRGDLVFQLRAAASLYRLKRTDSDRELLISVRDAFGEGADTVDLLEAADLLSS